MVSSFHLYVCVCSKQRSGWRAAGSLIALLSLIERENFVLPNVLTGVRNSSFVTLTIKVSMWSKGTVRHQHPQGLYFERTLFTHTQRIQSISDSVAWCVTNIECVSCNQPPPACIALQSAARRQRQTDGTCWFPRSDRCNSLLPPLTRFSWDTATSAHTLHSQCQEIAGQSVSAWQVNLRPN